ncbi:hypothetical protein FALBO_6008 [Fusarium albosuccineum]|uniref:Uncharacterized protein n=1 Tax=Fusarium albosuccineum TaxID=1237068 RepID=A0A8H4LCY9_9HYPO|nr:hypothetical protein FALBO_6008 [Fusarium albosuccineum]
MDYAYNVDLAILYRYLTRMKFTASVYAILALPAVATATAVSAANPAEVADAAKAPALLKRNCVLNAWWESN